MVKGEVAGILWKSCFGSLLPFSNPQKPGVKVLADEALLSMAREGPSAAFAPLWPRWSAWPPAGGLAPTLTTRLFMAGNCRMVFWGPECSLGPRFVRNQSLRGVFSSTGSPWR